LEFEVFVNLLDEDCNACHAVDRITGRADGKVSSVYRAGKDRASARSYQMLFDCIS
jgi:hypothetical protein